jgi:hypothetical protein
MSTKKSWSAACILALGIAVFLYLVIRAFNLSFTYDEAYSYLYYVRQKWNLYGPYTNMGANNHPVNTLLMRACGKLFGYGEFSLRLPNLAAGLIYLVYIFRFSTKYFRDWAAFFVFACLVLQPFLLDFFSLARGYGLAIAFMTASVYHALLFAEGQKKSSNLLICILFACTAVFCNLTQLLFLSSISVILLAIVWLGKDDTPAAKGKWSFLILFPLLLTIYFAYPWAKALEVSDSLYYGGHAGFWQDTVITLLRAMWYRNDFLYFLTPVFAVLSVLSIAAGLYLLIRRFVSARNFEISWMIIFLVMIGMGVQSYGLHLFKDTPFLFERTALPFLPLFLMFIFLMLMQEKFSAALLRTSALVLAFIFTGVFVFAFNLDHCEQWKEDRSIRQFVNAIVEDHNTNDPGDSIPVMIAMDYTFEPSVNYYRVTQGLLWLNLARVSDIYPCDAYCMTMDSSRVHGDRSTLSLMLHDKITNSKLYKVKEMAPYVVLMDTVMGFEGQAFTDLYKANGTDSLTHSGKRAGYTWPKFEYCTWHEMKFHDSLAGRHMLVESRGWVFQGGKCADGELVIEYLDSTGSFSWQSMPLLDIFRGEGEWHKFSYSRPVVLNLPKGGTVKLYLWNRGSSPILIDDVRTRLLLYPKPQIPIK